MHRFVAELWRWEGDGGWHFVTVPGDLSDEIEDRTAHRRLGFGSVRVEVTIGSTTWATSLFPDTKREAYLLPVKAPVRRAESIGDGDRVAVSIRLVED